MNQLLYWIEGKGLNSFLYDFFFVAGGVVLIVFCFGMQRTISFQ